MNPDAPYDDYVEKVVADLTPEDVYKIYQNGILRAAYQTYNIDELSLRAMLADAWLAGLGYSLNLIEEKKCSTDSK